MRVLDLNPAKGNSLVLSGSSIDLVRNVADLKNAVVGSGHSPSYDENGWLPDVPAMIMTGSATYTDFTKQWLFDEHVNFYDQVFSCTNVDYAAWTVFVVCQLNQLPAIESAIFGVSQQLPIGWTGSSPNRQANVFMYAGAASFGLAVYADSSGPSAGVTLGTSDTAPHILEATADGSGGFDGALDGVVTSGSDVHPKTCGAMALGAVFYACSPLEQMNGNIARVLIFDHQLSTVERTKVRNQLAAIYGIDL